jgi:diguanylate cyclase (GGDEF)-like protein
VLFLDLDRFKTINNTSGHDTGDQLLIAVTERLNAVVRDSDTLARPGGDEFVVLAEDIDIDDAVLLAERTRDALRDPISIGDNRIYSTASIGIAIATDGGTDAATLLSNADAAMHQAKHAGRDRIEIFDISLKNRLQHQLNTETDLRQAIQRDQLRVHYQPIVDVGSAMIWGTEALVRWQHPQRGLLTPDEFIPIAEQTGLITAIDRWVLHTACHQALSWDTSLSARLNISVNLSARQLVDPYLPSHMEDVIGFTGIEPDRICLEVTETALINHPIMAEANLRELRRLGINTALDHFGGYSSLVAHLQNLPLTHIKIDRTFTAGLGTKPTNTTIIESIIKLAHDLGLRVVAEGVETADQLALLQTYGCDLAQGFYPGRPQPPDQLEQHLEVGRPPRSWGHLASTGWLRPLPPPRTESQLRHASHIAFTSRPSCRSDATVG